MSQESLTLEDRVVLYNPADCLETMDDEEFSLVLEMLARDLEDCGKKIHAAIVRGSSKRISKTRP